jgi:probable HAF family extracellular repeat protein
MEFIGFTFRTYEKGGLEMKSTHCRIIVLFLMILILGLALASPGVAQNNSYNIIDLGCLPNGKNSEATGINDLGQVVGNSDTIECAPDADPCNSRPHAFFWTAEKGMADLDTLPGGNKSAAYGINNSAQVVGSSRTNSGSLAPFLWTQANGMIMIELDNLNLGIADVVSGEATGVNDWGQVTGYGYNMDTYISNAFKWTEQDGMTNLSAGQDYCVAKGINKNGQITGYWNNPSHAFLWENSAFRDLGTLGGDSSWANGINNVGYVIGGSYYNSSGASHAFLWNGGWIDLGTLGGINSEAMGLNDLGQIVGYSETASGDTHAFLWENGHGMQDLNNLIPGNSGWELLRALAINKDGQIVGAGKRDTNGDGVLDAVHAFLLTPIKENPPPPDPPKILKVGIDIWPSSGSNRINLLFRYGMIRVTILSTKDFYAPDMIDRHSLTFGDTGDEKSLAFCRSHPRYGHHHGLKDLVCYFYTRHAGFKCGDTEGILKGKTVKGRPIEGRDAVQIVPCPKRKNIHGR